MNKNASPEEGRRDRIVSRLRSNLEETVNEAAKQLRKAQDVLHSLILSLNATVSNFLDFHPSQSKPDETWRDHLPPRDRRYIIANSLLLQIFSTGGIKNLV